MWTLSAVDFHDAAANVLLAAGTDPALPMLHAVRLHVAGGRLHLAATDRYRPLPAAPRLGAAAPRHPPPGGRWPVAWPVLFDRADLHRILTLLRPTAGHAGRTGRAHRRTADRTGGMPLVRLAVPVGPQARSDGAYRPQGQPAGRVVVVHLPDGVAVPAPLVDTTFPPVEATLARLPGFQPADQAAFNPLFLAAYATLRNGGRPIDRRRHPIRLRFRDPDGRQAVQITSSGRPTFTADLMPCTPHHNDHHHHPDRTRP